VPAKKLSQFGGGLPGWDDRLLPDGQSSQSINSYVFSGALEGWRMPKLLRALNNSAAQFVYRIPLTTIDANGIETFSSSLTGPSTWLEFDDPDTNVVRSQVVNDQFQRYYSASPSQTPQYNTLARIQAGSPNFQLGINPPGCAPEVIVEGGGSSATLGYTTGNGDNGYIYGNTCQLFPIIPNAAMTIADVQWMPMATDATCSFAAVIYQDLNDGGNVPTAPGVLLGVGSVITGITAGVLADSQFVNQPGLIANSPYWVGILINNTEAAALGDNLNTSVSFTNTFTNGPPGVAPGVSTGQADLQMYADLTTTDVYEARSYVYTWVSAYGEESPPSPYTLVNGWANGTWTIGLYNPVATDMGVNRNLAILRLYRTVVGTSGSTVYFFVADVSLGSSDPDAIAAVAADTGCLPPNTIYTDILSDAVVALTLQMPSTNYYPPPVNMQGITAMPNGMYVGFVDNQIWFSEPYYPHAWPPGTVLTTDFPIVGLGLTSGTLVACTAANPWTITGVNPTQMSMVKCAKPEPCTSRGSILSTDAGVYFISPNGLIMVNSSSTSTNTTELWITRERWAQLAPQMYTRSVALSSTYFCFGATSPPSVSPVDNSQAQTGFNIELNTDNTSFSIWPEPGGHRVGFNEMTAPYAANIQNILTDPWTSIGLMIQNGNVYYWDFTDPLPTMQPYDWTSKLYQDNTKKSYSAFKVFFTVPSGSPTPGLRNTAPTNDPSWNALTANQWLIVKIYVDVQQDGAGTGQFTLVCAREVQKSGEVLRIPDGFKTESFYVEFLGRVVVSNMQIATSVHELGNV